MGALPGNDPAWQMMEFIFHGAVSATLERRVQLINARRQQENLPALTLQEALVENRIYHFHPSLFVNLEKLQYLIIRELSSTIVGALIGRTSQREEM